jgi:hypothetical protein
MTDLADNLFDLASSMMRVSAMAHGIEPEPKRILKWVPCWECGGDYERDREVGTTGNPGMGPTWMPVEAVDICPRCDHGYEQVDEGDSRWADGTFAHPHG